MVKNIKSLSGEVTIGLVGKYVELHDAYISVVEALSHGGYANNSKVEIKWVNAEEIETGVSRGTVLLKFLPAKSSSVSDPFPSPIHQTATLHEILWVSR